MTNFYDVIVIGAGVVGNAIARELSRFNIKAAVLERKTILPCNSCNWRFTNYFEFLKV